jgi:hypothetical protein
MKDLGFARLPVVPVNPIEVDDAALQLERFVQAMVSFAPEHGIDPLKAATTDELETVAISRLATASAVMRTDIHLT